jgi:hypothetical protein
MIARLTAEVNQIACDKTKSIQQITNQMKMPFHATPGYEAYRGLGWFGVIVSGAG